MKNLIVWKKIFFVLLTVSFLSGCEPYGTIGGDDKNIEGALPELLRGEWIYIKPGETTPAEKYIIENNTIEYGFKEKENTNFKGYIRYVSNYSGNSGVIIIEYIDDDHRPTYPLYNGNDFFGIYYRNLKKNTVQLANAVEPDGWSAPDTAALNEAIEKFTRLKMDSYVGWGHVMPQSRVR